MDTEKSSYQVKWTCNTTQSDNSRVDTLATVNMRIGQFNNENEAQSIWRPLHVLGVFGCMYLLFHLYISMTYHHAALNDGLHKLEEEMRVMMELQRASGNVSGLNTVSSPVVTSVHQAYYGHDRILPHERKRHLASHERVKNRMVKNLGKRDGSILTWFHPGLGACGGHNSGDDFIAAVSHEIWNGGAHCGDKISILYHGKSATATVVDECMACEANHIDLSPSLFDFIAGTGTDMVTDADWMFGGINTPKPAPQPTTSTTYHSTTEDKPTTTPELTTTSTTGIAKTVKSSSSSSSSSSTIKVTTTTSSSSSSSSLTSPTTISSSASAYVTPVTYDDGQVHNIRDFETLLVIFGQLVTLGA